MNPLGIWEPLSYKYNLSDYTPATNTVVGSPIPVELGPIGVAFNSINDILYVTNLSDDNVTVIDCATNTVVGTYPIPVGNIPVGIAFNEDNGNLYVANFNGDTVSVIAPLTTTFSEGCNGAIDSGGQTATCMVTNAYGETRLGHIFS